MVYTETVADDVYIRADDSTGRRSRASQITARKLRYERERGVTLTLVSKSYSETYGFLSRSEFRYSMRRAPRVTMPGSDLTSPAGLINGFPVMGAYTVGILAAAARAGGHTGPRGFVPDRKFTAGGWVAYLESARMREMTRGES